MLLLMRRLILFQKIGKRLILSGLIIYKIGAYPDRYGGVIGFLHGIAKIKSMLELLKK